MILHLIILFSALSILTNLLIKKKKDYLPPSPLPSLPIIGHLYLFFKRPLHRTLSKISSKNGPILLLKFGFRSVLLVSSPSLAEECLTKNDVTFANRPLLLSRKYVGSNYNGLAWSPYGHHWRDLRRISTLELLSTKRLKALSSIRMDEVRSLIRRLCRNQNQKVELKPFLYEFALNVMTRMIAGKRYCDDNLAGNEEVKRFQEIVTGTDAPNIVDVLPALRWIGFGGVKRLKLLGEKRDRFMHDLLEEHRRKMASDKTEDCLNEDRKKTMIEGLLSLQELEPEYYTDKVIGSLMMLLILAGRDSSVNTIEWALSLLLNHPEELKKAQTEIDHQVGFDRLISESDVPQLPYLRGIINETLRMFPSAPLLGPHESSDECTVDGFRIPRGTMLIVNCWAMQNDPKIWVDPRKFKPERFGGLEGARDGFKFMPFGSGRRGCPGEGLGLRTVWLTLGTLIQCFDWKRVGEEMVDMTEKSAAIAMSKAHPLKALWQPRPAMLSLLSQI